MTAREFEIQFHSLYMPLCMYALRLTGNISDAEDTVQEAFTNAWTLIDAGGTVNNFRAYMYRTVHNEALRKPCRCDFDLINMDECGHVSEDVIDTSERDAALWRAIDRLPARCREIFLMSKRDGMSNADIAEELEISMKTVENQMTKAYKALRLSLAPRGGKVFFLPFL